jgi:endosialidase-like protein
MKKKIITLVTLVLFVHLGYSQLQVISNGFVGIGTNSPIGNLNVQGSHFITAGGNTFRFLANNPGTEIGSSYGNINFWYTTSGWHTLYAHKYNTISDERLKQNINPLVNTLTILQQLNGVSFQYKNLDTLGNPIQGNTGDSSYGFIAQDVQKVLPLLVSQSSKGYLALDYSAITPFLVEGIKQQQLSIDSLRGGISVPNAPVLVSPANGTSGDYSLATNLTWNSVSKGITLYHLQIATDGAFSNIVNDEPGLTDTTVASGFSCDTAVTTYYWRVNAQNNAGTGVWSNVFSFTDTTICHRVIMREAVIDAVGFASASDSLFKTNVTPLTNSLAKVNQLQGVNYDWLHNNSKYVFDSTAQIGFIAQDVQRVVPQVVSKDQNGYLAVDYGRMAPLFVESIKTLKTNNDSLQAQIDRLTSLINSCCSNNSRTQQTGGLNTGANATDAATSIGTVSNIELASNSAIIYQNIPNPFGDGTMVKYYVPENTTNAQIIFYDQFGSQLNTFTITQTGAGQINVASTNLAPGTYSYSLIINGKVVDTKRMIKTTN